MRDDIDFQKESLKAAKRGVNIGAWGLVVAVLGLGYTVLTDLGGAEWISGIVKDWFEGPSDVPAHQGGVAGGVEDPGLDGSGWSGWLFNPGDSFWAGMLRQGLIGIACQTVLIAVNIAYLHFSMRSFNYFYWWVREVTLLATAMVGAAVVMGEGSWHAPVLASLSPLFAGFLSGTGIVIAEKFEWTTTEDARWGLDSFGFPRRRRYRVGR